MAVTSKIRKRVSLSVAGQSFINRVIDPKAQGRTYTENDYMIIDLLSHKAIAYGDFLKLTDRQESCWDVEIMLATVPTTYATPEYLAGLNTAPQGDWRNINADIGELIYHHEGICSVKDIQIMVGKLYLEYVDPKTTLLVASAKITPMSLPQRLKRHGTFKTPVDASDTLDINYYFDSSLIENLSFFERPFTNA